MGCCVYSLSAKKSVSFVSFVSFGGASLKEGVIVREGLRRKSDALAPATAQAWLSRGFNFSQIGAHPDQ